MARISFRKMLLGGCRKQPRKIYVANGIYVVIVGTAMDLFTRFSHVWCIFHDLKFYCLPLDLGVVLLSQEDKGPMCTPKESPDRSLRFFPNLGAIWRIIPGLVSGFLSPLTKGFSPSKGLFLWLRGHRGDPKLLTKWDDLPSRKPRRVLSINFYFWGTNRAGWRT